MKVKNLVSFSFFNKLRLISYYGLMSICKKEQILIIPFSKNSPHFLTKKFFKLLYKLKKISRKIIIFCFYLYNGYRNQLNALLIKDKKIKDIFGESFTSKSSEFKLNESSFKVLFYYDFYSKKVDLEYFVIGLDDDKLVDDLSYQINKFNGRVLFVGKDGESFCTFYNKNKKSDEKHYKFYVQIFDKLLK